MKNIIPALAACLVISSAAHGAPVYSTEDMSLDVIGRAKVNFYNNEANSERRMTGTARLGVDGKTRVMDNLKVYGYLLYDLAAHETKQTSDRLKIRYGYVGFDMNLAGRISFGRFENAFYKTTAPTDLFTDWGDGGVSYWKLTANDYGGRMDGQALYDFNLNGWFLALSYNFKDTSKYLEKGYSGTVGYEFENVSGQPLGFMAGINHLFGLKDDRRGYGADGWFYGADKKEYAVSVYYGSFGAPGFYAAAVYNHGELEKTYKGDGGEIAFSYTTPESLFTFTGTYGYIKNQDRSLTRYQSSRLSTTWTGNITWKPTSNFNIYSEFEHRLDNAWKDEKDTLLTLGLIYNF
ncbi:MAG: porin [Succinivibrionaceae bacterium]